MRNNDLEKLAKVEIYPDLTLDTPAGDRVRITHAYENTSLPALRVNCANNRALWALLDLSERMGAIGGGYRALKKLRSPFLQDIVIAVDERELLLWRPGKWPKVRSLRGVMSWLSDGSRGG